MHLCFLGPRKSEISLVRRAPQTSIFKHKLLFFCNREFCGEKQNYGCDEASIRFQSSCSDFNTTVLKSRLNSGQNAGLNLGSNIRINISLYWLGLKKSCYACLWLCSCYDKAIKVTFRSGYGSFRSDILRSVI